MTDPSEIGIPETAAHHSELETKKHLLARFLLGLAYGARTPAEQDLIVTDTEPEIFENYVMDADDMLRVMPHLFGLDEVERLEADGYFRPAPREGRPSTAQRR